MHLTLFKAFSGVFLFGFLYTTHDAFLREKRDAIVTHVLH